MSARRLRRDPARALGLIALMSSCATQAGGLETLTAHQSYTRATACLEQAVQGCTGSLLQYLNAAQRTLQPGAPVQTGQELRLRLAQRKVYATADRLRHQAAQQLDTAAHAEADQLINIAVSIDAILGYRQAARHDLTPPPAPLDSVRVIAVLPAAPASPPEISPSSEETPFSDTASMPSGPEETASLPLHPSVLER